MAEIRLNNNKGFPWHSRDGVYVKGYLFDHKGDHHSEDKLIEYFDNVKNRHGLTDKCRLANGSFAVVITRNDRLLFAVDHIRSIPLFFGGDNDRFIISDEAEEIKRFLRTDSLDEQSVNEFILAGFTFGDTTLFKGIRQVLAGQLIYKPKKDDVQVHTYYKHHLKNFLNSSEQELIEQLDSISDNIFQRLGISAGNATLVIPLSGGLDSRYIAAMLKRHDHNKVICYTYGRPDSFEVETSKAVAEKLGFKWHFIPFTTEVFENYFSNINADYESYASNYASLPYQQEFFAVQQLKMQQLVPDDSIFIPGFCGDLLAGSWMLNKFQQKRVKYSAEGMAQYIYRNKKHLAQHKRGSFYDPNIFKKLQSSISQLDINDEIGFSSHHQGWGVQHRITKFLINSMRVFEYFGYRWRLPLWDLELVDFWYKVPFQFKYDKNLYRSFLKEKLFDGYGVDFEHKNIDSYSTHGGVFTYLKLYTPRFIKKILKPLFLSQQDRDLINYNALYDMIHDKLADKQFVKKDYDINFIKALWFIQNLREQLSKNYRNE